MSGDVIYLAPKSDMHTYKRINYTITFIPSSRQWQWSFEVTSTTRYSGTSDSETLAILSARQHINLMVGA